MGELVAVNVGLPRDVAWRGRTVHTGVWKHPVDGPQMVRTLNIDGDGQGDLAGHGGPHRAVLVYQLDSYDYWRRQLGRDDFEYGQFGENFTVEGLADDEVCIGDRYAIGDGAVRGEPAPGDLLPRRPAARRAAAAGAARGAPAARVLPAGPARGAWSRPATRSSGCDRTRSG